MLEKPVFGRDAGDVGAGGKARGRGGEIFFGDVAESAEGDETDGAAQRARFEVGGGQAGMLAETPADFVGHPVADAGAGILIEKEGFEGFFGVARDEAAHPGQGEFGILGLRREVSPGILVIVEHDASEHAVVVEDQRGLFGPENEVVVFVFFVVGGGESQFSGHAEVDFEVELRFESEEHALAVGAR